MNQKHRRKKWILNRINEFKKQQKYNSKSRTNIDTNTQYTHVEWVITYIWELKV